MKNVVYRKEWMLTYRALWPDEAEPDPAVLLAEVPLTAAIVQVAGLLQRLVNRTKNQTDFQARELVAWQQMLCTDAGERVGAFAREEQLLQTPDFKLTDRIGCLCLLQELLRCSRSTGDRLTATQQTLLFKCLLIFNGRYLRAQEPLFNWAQSDNEQVYLDLVLPAKISEQGIDQLRDHQVAFTKAFYFFEFCAQDDEYQPLLQIFLADYGLADYRAYLKAVVYPYLLYMSQPTPTVEMLVDPGNQAALDFFERLVINDQVVAAADFKTLRQYPLFQYGPFSYVFLYANFFADKLYTGMLFDFVAVLGRAGVTDLNFSKLKTDMGNRFSEHWLFYRTMRLCFGRYGDHRYSGAELKLLLKQGEPDYYIQGGRKLFLFEFKDVLLRADAKASEDADRIRRAISDKLEEVEDGPSTGQSKGIRQLFNSISAILAGAYREAGVDQEDPAQVMIYPVLVHTDQALAAEGVNYYLRGKLNRLLKDAGFPAHRVKDVVLIHVDMLLALSDLFAEGKINLAACLNDFIAYTQAAGPMNRMIAFDEYLKYYVTRKGYRFYAATHEFTRLAKLVFL